MAPDSSFSEKPTLLIEANFKQSRSVKILRLIERSLCFVLAGFALLCVLLYGQTVEREAQLLELGNKGREVTEQNAALKVEYNKKRSYASLSANLDSVPFLHYPQRKLVIETDKLDKPMRFHASAWRNWLPNAALPQPVKAVNGL